MNECLTASGSNHGTVHAIPAMILSLRGIKFPA